MGSGKIKICPNCNREYSELMNFCSKCGIRLEAPPNRCSEMRSTMCKHITYKDDDLYCSYCGALTTYAIRSKEAHIGEEETNDE